MRERCRGTGRGWWWYETAAGLMCWCTIFRAVWSMRGMERGWVCHSSCLEAGLMSLEMEMERDMTLGRARD